MVHNRGFRPRNGGGVRDARDVIRSKSERKSVGVRGAALRGPATAKRIIRTAGGLVTNKKPKGISTSQLQHRQRDQKVRPSVPNRANQRPFSSGERLTAAIRRSAVVSSSPVFQSILCYLMPMDSTVGARTDIDDDDDATVSSGIAPAVPAAVDTKPPKTITHQDLNRNDADATDERTEELARLEQSLADDVGDSQRVGFVNPRPSDKANFDDVVLMVESQSDAFLDSEGSLQSKDDSLDAYGGSDSDADDFELPKTCHVLRAPNGCTVYVVGSAHFSRESQHDVRRVIRSVRPNRVVVELCKQRMNILTLDEQVLLRESSGISMQTIMETISKMGTLQGGMYLLLIHLSAHITSKLKIAPGGEFRVAYQEASKLHNCQVFLGDRQISITLKRAWASLGIWQRLSIVWTLLFTDEDISAEDVELCKEKDILEQLLGEMCTQHPELSRVLVSERDLYLCRSLFDIAMTPPVPSSIVAVVGIGHQQGIIKHWDEADNIDLHQLTVIPQPSLAVRVTNKAFRVGMWFGVGLIVYKLTPRSLRALFVSRIDTGVRMGTEKLSGLLWSAK